MDEWPTAVLLKDIKIVNFQVIQCCYYLWQNPGHTILRDFAVWQDISVTTSPTNRDY